jgi:cold shock CspA family protein
MAERVTGKVSKWLDEKGFGFITFGVNKSAFIHHSEIDVGVKGKKHLEVGQEVEFSVEQNEKGYRAKDLIRI